MQIVLISTQSELFVMYVMHEVCNELPSDFHEQTKFQQLKSSLQISLTIVLVKFSSNYIPVDLPVFTAWPHMVLRKRRTLTAHSGMKRNQGNSTNLHIVSLQQTRNAGIYVLLMKLVQEAIKGHKLLRLYRQWFLLCLLEQPFTYSGNWKKLPFLAPCI